MARLMVVLAALLVVAAARLDAQGKGSEGVVKATASIKKVGGETILTVQFAVEKGWHIYANPPGNDDLKPVATTVTLQGGTKGEVVYPAGKQVIDPVVGNYRVYEGTEEIRVKLASEPSGPVKIQASFQACNEKSCLQPSKVTLEAK
jgi:DsbC/DsbD-like thiol-disulfide interchange protein